MISENSIIHRITRWSFAAGMVWVLAMMALTAVDVTTRHTFSAPVPGSIELSEIMLALFGILGMAYTEHVGANVKVRVLENILPERVGHLLNALTSLLSLSIMLLVAWQSCLSGIEEFHYKTATDTLGIRIYPFYYLLSLGCFVLCLEIFSKMLNSFHGFIKNTERTTE